MSVHTFSHDTSQDDYQIPSPFDGDVEPFSLYQQSFFPLIPTISYRVVFDDLKKHFKGRKNK